MVWEAFVDLSSARQIGMAACPITWSDIEAYRRLTFEPLSAWDVRLIKRIDNAILPIINPAPENNTVSARDGKGVLNLVRGAAKKGKPA